MDMVYRIWYTTLYRVYRDMGVMGYSRDLVAWGDVETLAFCDDKSVHGCESKSVMISVHGSERLYDDV